MRGAWMAAAVGIAAWASAGMGEDRPLAIRKAKIVTATGEIFEPGTLVVDHGKIVAAGLEKDVQLPANAEIRDLSGKVIIPGLVDSHSHLGVYSKPSIPANGDGNEMTGPVQSMVRAMDSFDPRDPGIKMALAGGVTTANVMPGSANVIGGQTLYVKLRGRTVDEMHIKDERAIGGLKMANGENPKRVYGSKGSAPGTRMKVAALQRAELLKAKDYQRKWAEYRKKLGAGEKAAPPDVDLSLEPLVEVLERKRPVHFHCHRADDIYTTLRLAEEFGFELIVQHGTEAYKIPEELARRKVAVSLTLVDSPGGKAEIIDLLEDAAAQLTKAGVKVLVNTDDPVTDSRMLLRTTAIAVRGGLTDDVALKAITLYPAQAMHLDHRVGSLEKGKDADFVVLSGDPFSVYTQVLETYIDGRKVFDAASEDDRPYQTGGFALPDRKSIPSIQPTAKGPAFVAPSISGGLKAPTGGSTEFAVYAGRLHTVAHGTIEDGAVHVKDGKIVFAGPRRELKIGGEVPVLTAAAVTPGLIDAYTVVPLSGELNIAADQDADEKSDPNQADVRVIDGFNPREPALRFLLEQGTTVVHAGPGHENAIAGTTGVFRTHGRTVDAMTIRYPQAMLFNLGEAPKSAYPGKKPGTRMGTASLLRSALAGTANFTRKQKSAEKDAPPADRDLKNEALALVLDRKIPAIFAAQRSDDIVTSLRIAKEFNLRGVIALAAEAYLAADEIADAKVPVIVHPTMQRIGAMETYHTVLSNAAGLSNRGMPFAIATAMEDYVPKTRVVRYEAAMAMVNGLGFDKALRSVTIDAAKILEIEDRYGSIEAGKIADLVLYDGDPFEHRTHVTHVVIDGRLVHDRSEQQRIPFARRLLHSTIEMPCCLGF